ncbi:MAG TPA: archaellin/type IV pilin N-terminal domain-containing protein [Candidatus Nanoarchaeia archaeon]|nr:archaellin/type IV pilin N-terminal domain-containing protein [Candidatus Nanoarchaeia archaeon]
MRKNKRGVSPLLAAVLLVAFSVALAGIVANYVIKKTNEFDPNLIAEETIFCESVNLGYSVDVNPITNFRIRRAGQTGPGLNGNIPTGVELLGPFTIINKGSFTIHQVIVNAPGIGSRTLPIGAVNVGLSPSAGSNRLTNYYVQLDSTALGKITLVPIIKDNEKDQFVRCPKQELIIDYIQLCNDLRTRNTGFDCGIPLGNIGINTDPEDELRNGNPIGGGIN